MSVAVAVRASGRLEGDDTIVLPERRRNGTSSTSVTYGVRAMSADGSVLAGTSFDSTALLPSYAPGSFSGSGRGLRRFGHAFSLTPKGDVQPLPPLPGDTETVVTSVSEDGAIVVGASGDGTHSTAVFWTLDGAVHSIAELMSDAGYGSPSTELLVTDGAKSARLLWGKARGGTGDEETWAWILSLP